VCTLIATQLLGWRREDHVISTKLFWGGDGPNDVGLSRKHIIEGCKVSLLGGSITWAIPVMYVLCIHVSMAAGDQCRWITREP
jgi:hypothetical protein